MKTFPFIYIVCLFVLAACDTQTEVEPKQEIENASKEEIKSTVSCISSTHQIYKKTVEMWHQSWLWANDMGEEEETVNYTFSKDNLSELENMFQETSGLRMYYGLMEEDTIPTLLLVNINGCSDQFHAEESSVLIPDAEGGHFIGTDSAAILTANWETYTCSKIPFYTPVYAYNYDWDIIHYIQGIGINSEEELNVSFGLRSISPGDDWYDPKGLTHKGSIVYVNILHAANFLANANHNFDFTMPCPQFCDAQSEILNMCTE